LPRTPRTPAQIGETARRARQRLEGGVQQSREAAADALHSAGRGLRRRSSKAADALERGGADIASRLEGSASRIRGERGPLATAPFRYARRHPLLTLLFVGLAGIAVAGFVVPALRRQANDEEEWDPGRYEGRN